MFVYSRTSGSSKLLTLCDHIGKPLQYHEELLSLQPMFQPKIYNSMEEVDNYIPTPIRDTDETFLMAIEDAFSISGRGAVATGKM